MTDPKTTTLCPCGKNCACVDCKCASTCACTDCKC